MNKTLLQIKRYFGIAMIAAALSLTLAGPAAAQTNGKKELSFSSQVIFGAQKNNLAIVVSSDFNGDYSMEGIKKATWTDVTARFKLADTKEWQKSGDGDISSLAVPGKTLYVGLRYVGNKSSVGPTQRMWGVKDMYVSGKELPSADWKIVNDPNNFEGAGFTRPKAGGILFRSNQSIIRSESWGIVKLL